MTQAMEGKGQKHGNLVHSSISPAAGLPGGLGWRQSHKNKATWGLGGFV